MSSIKSVENFYKKYNNKRLADCGCEVSKEYRLYQNAFIRMMKDIAASIGANVVKTTKGHYYESLFLERDGKHIYVFHENTDRTFIGCDSERFIYYRTASSDSDYNGGINRHTSLKLLQFNLDRLFENFESSK